MIHDPYLLPGIPPESAGAAAGEIFAAPASPSEPVGPPSEPVGMEAKPNISTGDHKNPAMEAVLALRVRQIEEFGHTPESDAAAPLRHFAQELARAAQAFAEDVQFNKPTDHMHRHLVKLGALALAAIDRVAIIPFPTSQTGEHHG